MIKATRYNDRLEVTSYSGDVECQLRLMPDPREERSEPIEGWIAERLLARLRHLGLAYELPLLGRLPRAGVETYPEVQMPALEDELAFLFSVVSDDVLLKAVAPLHEMMKVAMLNPRGWVLQIDAP